MSPQRHLGPLRGAIVGFGKVAEAAHLEALAGAGLEVVAVADPSAERRALAERLAPGCRSYAGAEALLDAETLDWVLVATPPSAHFDAAAAALARGVHVLCEKPLVLDAAHGASLAGLAATRGLALTCMHNWVHAPIVARALALVQGGAIGRVRELRWVTLRTQPAGSAGGDDWRVDPARAGGGILFDHGWHAMSVIRELAARPALAVRARVEHVRGGPVEDAADATVELAGGGSARIELTWNAERRGNRLDVIGERGAVHVADDELRLISASGAEAERFDESLAGGGYRPTWCAAVVARFRAEILDPAARGRGADEALDCLALVLAAYRSAREGGRRVALGVERPPAASGGL